MTEQGIPGHPGIPFVFSGEELILAMPDAGDFLKILVG
jgi:hypothetical protein